MNVRLPVFVGVVAVAAGVAVFRATHAAPKAAFAIATSTGAGEPAAAARHVDSMPRIVVYVAGAVKRGGVYTLAPRARAVDAIRAAGGANANADLVAVNLAALVGDGDEVVVPLKGSTGSEAAARSSQETRPRRHGKHRRKRRHHHASAVDAPQTESVSATHAVRDDAGDAGPAAPIDINVADASELETLPGIGSSLAERIVLFREANGPYAAHDDLLDVGGMTQKRLDAIEPFLTSL